VNEGRLHPPQRVRELIDGHVMLGVTRIVGSECVLRHLACELAQGQRALARRIDDQLTFEQTPPPLFIVEGRIEEYAVVCHCNPAAHTQRCAATAKKCRYHGTWRCSTRA
jgi:hypothetical protein